MSNRLYDILKWICVILLPACATLIFSLGQIFEWGWAGIVVGVIEAVDFFIGALIGVSTAQYNKVKKDEDK